MMRIEVLGPGCARCNRLEAMVRAAADRLGLAYEIAHIREIEAILQRGVTVTPALAVDGRVVVAGRLPGEAELEGWLRRE